MRVFTYLAEVLDRMRLPLFIISISLLVCLVPHVSAQDPIHHRYTLNEGAPSNTLYGSTQDRRGFLWFGSDAGVTRFDGRNFVNYDQNDGLPDEEVLTCYEDGQGRIWLLMLNGKLAYFKNDTLFHPGNEASLRTVNGRSGWGTACEDRDGNIWFGGVWGELIKLDANGVFHEVDLSFVGFEGGNVVPISDRNGDLFLYMNGIGFLYQDGKFQRTFEFDVPAPKATFSSSKDGRKWYASTDGLVEVGRTRNRPRIKVEDLGPWDKIRSIAIADDDLLIYGRWDRGAMIIDLRSRTKRWVFRDETVNNVVLDDEGNCWLSTDGGGLISFRLDQIDSRIMEQIDGLPVGPVVCLHVDSHGGLWAGTNTGMLLQFKEDRTVQHDLRLGSTRVQRVRAICDNGRYLYATSDLTTVRLPMDGKGELKHIGYHERILDKYIDYAPNKVLICLRKGGLVGAYYELVRSSSVEPPELKPFLTKELGIGRYHMLFEDPEGNLWIQRNDELFCYDGDRLRSMTELAEHAAVRITGMAALSDGTLVMGTLGRGVVFLRDGRIVHRVTQANGLLSDRCEHISVTNDTIAVAASMGVQLMVYSSRSGEPTYDLLAPWSNIEGAMDAVLHGGQLVVATGNGIVRTSLDADVATPRPPRPYVTRITNQSQSFPPDKYFQTDHDRATITIDVAVVSLVPSIEIDLQYRLDDAASWTNIHTTSLSLLTLEPGEHVVHFRASNARSSWSEELHVPFAVLPPFWAHAWFRVPIVFLLAGLGFLLLRYLARQRYERQHEQLRRRELVVEERQRIAMDLHDDLGSDLSGTSMLAEAAILGEHDAQLALMEMIVRVRGMVPKVDEIIWALDSKDDNLSALIMHLERSTRAKAEAMDLRFEFAGPWGYMDRLVNSEFRRVVLMIVKEAVNNALKHSKCTALELIIELEDDSLYITVEDNGIGITTPLSERKSHGLNNVRKRAEQFNGTVEIAERPPHGTTVTIALPLP